MTNAGIMYHNGQGADQDLFALLSDITHCTFITVPIARNDAFDMVERGEIDLFTSAHREPHRESFAWFIPYFEINFLLLVNADRLPNVADMEEFKLAGDATIARTTGGGYSSYFNYQLSELESLGRVQFYDDYAETVTALLNGQVDATLSVPQIYRLFFSKGEAPIPIRILDVSPAPPTTVSLMLGKQRFSASHAANWLRIIEELHLNGQLESLLARYVSTNEAAAMVGVSSR
ncbi:transporter substrate-binding domain-containing protein [Halomonas sp. IOP_14]|uniref:substrate-binding periplasmic protein n=1 Tax=Halomonas sp. IOP_14 TaxID=2873295 RepID=UPI001E55986F|nr:transporter substrate-binding domain-containing protein [Halomonas sp. IOP_14]MCD1586687.1 transporter substrate-binding domain-containing protein [Halomonas sp. IOP_14]